MLLELQATFSYQIAGPVYTSIYILYILYIHIEWRGLVFLVCEGLDVVGNEPLDRGVAATDSQRSASVLDRWTGVVVVAISTLKASQQPTGTSSNLSFRICHIGGVEVRMLLDQGGQLPLELINECFHGHNLCRTFHI